VRPADTAAAHEANRAPTDRCRPASDQSDAHSISLAADGVQPLTRLCTDASGVAFMLGLSLRTVRAMNARGALPKALRCGRRRLFRVDEIRRWVASGCPSREAWEHAEQSTGGAQ
jgi:predicted DNA-binding transcriptional regulator AlpA